MWKKDDLGIFTKELPKGWERAEWSDFFVGNRFLLNHPFLAYNKTLKRYDGYRTNKSCPTSSNFQINLTDGLIFVQKKSINS